MRRSYIARRTPLKRSPLIRKAWKFKNGEPVPARPRDKAVTPRAVLKQRITDACHMAVRLMSKGSCPFFPTEPVQCAYHIIRKARGHMVRWDPENIIGASNKANAGEHFHPAKYRAWHVEMFGAERIERLEARAKLETHWGTDDLRVMLAFWKHRLEFALIANPPANPHEGELRMRGMIL